MIPVCEPTLIGNERKYVLDCLDTNWISSSGKYIEEFEKKFSEFCGVKHGISCCNGTVALHLALEALGIGKGDEVIIPTFTMIATCNAVIYTGAKPVLVDSERESWNIDPGKIEEKITDKTKAIMVMHTYGHPCDMDIILELAKKYDLKVIEDAAEAHGAEYRGKKIGSLGDVSCFSFYANKIITTGEGGMVVTNNDKIAERVRYLKDQAYSEPRFFHKEVGFNYRMTNLQAAIGLAQTEKIEELIEKRRRNAELYNSLLKDVKGVKLPVEREGVKNVYWMYGVLIKKEFGVSKEEVMEKLKEKGIGTRSFFYGMHRQPAYEKEDEKLPDISGEYKVSDELSEKGLYLPSGSSLTEGQIKEVVEAIKSLSR